MCRAVESDGAKFIEVYVKCPIGVLAERDVKGLYKRALAGEIKEFTGVSDPYEEPLMLDVVVETNNESVEMSVAKIIRGLEHHRLVPELALAGSVREQLYANAEEVTPGSRFADPVADPERSQTCVKYDYKPKPTSFDRLIFAGTAQPLKTRLLHSFCNLWGERCGLHWRR